MDVHWCQDRRSLAPALLTLRVPDNAADGAWRRGVSQVSHVSHVTLAAFNQEKALVGAFSVITNFRLELFQALLDTLLTLVRARAAPRHVQRDQRDQCHEPHHGSR